MPSSNTTTQVQQGLDTAGTANATNDPTSTRSSNTATDVQRGLDTSMAGAANATNGLATATEKAPEQADQGLGTARQAVTNEKLSRATDLNNGNMVKPSETPPTNPTKNATGVLQDVRDRVATQTTSQAANGLSNASEHVKNAGPKDSAPNTEAKTGGGK